MTESLILSPLSNVKFTRFKWLVAAILAVALILVWMTGNGPRIARSDGPSSLAQGGRTGASGAADGTARPSSSGTAGGANPSRPAASTAGATPAASGGFGAGAPGSSGAGAASGFGPGTGAGPGSGTGVGSGFGSGPAAGAGAGTGAGVGSGPGAPAFGSAGPSATSGPAAAQGGATGALRPPPSLTLERSPKGGFTVSGTVPDVATRDQWLNAVRIGAQGRPVSDALTIAPVAADAPAWAPRLRELTGLVRERNLESVRLEGDRLILRGPKVAQAYRADTEQRFKAQLPTTMRVETRDRDMPAAVANRGGESPAGPAAVAGTANAPANPSATRAAAGCPAALDDLTAPVYFATDSAALGRADARRLATLGRCIGNRRLRVVGHADSRHSAAHNLELSRRRADAVAIAIKGGGAGDAAVTATGVGEDRSGGSDASRLQRSRRVDIRLR